MPTWAAIVVGVAAVITALTVIWAKAIRPGAKVISQGEAILPLVLKLTAEFKDAPEMLKVLRQMASQFQTDSGSSLRDVVNRLEMAAEKNAMVAEKLAEQVATQRELDRIRHDELKMQVEVQRELAIRDREQLVKIIDIVSVVDARVRVGLSGIADITREQHDVATDLKASIGRADHADPEQPGAGADAALRSAEQFAQEQQAKREDVTGG